MNPITPGEDPWIEATSKELGGDAWGRRNDWRALCLLIVDEPDRDALIRSVIAAGVSPAVMVRLRRRQAASQETAA